MADIFFSTDCLLKRSSIATALMKFHVGFAFAPKTLTLPLLIFPFPYQPSILSAWSVFAV